ncbi:cysteine desulfurase family protein [Brevibacillus fluminis]|uniref:cysteine desulfurase family protein n=1 Tax=Brevibacillus fluminis TaxID=511487 RepID=UPI003F8BCE5F
MTDVRYFDHAATTPLHPQVVDAMQPYLHEHFGNPSSFHRYGRAARAAVETAREEMARLLGITPRELIFTGGATEADNTAIISMALGLRHKGNHIITTAIEHHAVLHACEYLQSLGFDVTYLPVDETGMVHLETLKAAVREDTILVSIIYGNNEVGTIQPIEAIGAFLREKDILFHTDAVQVAGAIPLNVGQLPVDLLSLTAHKINGPKGIGALYVHKNVNFHPFIHGGAQERKRRAGTENVAGIVGFAEGLKRSVQELDERVAKYRAMREAMLSVWAESGIEFAVNGHPETYLPHILNVSFPAVDTETMLMNLDIAGIAAASGSACTSGSLELSHVLVAMGLPEERANSAIRFSFGLGVDVEDAVHAAQAVVAIIKRIKR